MSSGLYNTVQTVSPLRDSYQLKQLTAKGLEVAKPKKVLYYNYFVGECKDLMFGVSLLDYASSRGLKERDMPKVVKICIKEVEERGLKLEGIYRVRLSTSMNNNNANIRKMSGRQATVVEVRMYIMICTTFKFPV